MTAPEPVADPIEQANQRIRDAAKWLIASSAAVGAALIAGSQLSSIGRLDVGLPTTIGTARLWIASLGALLSLVAVVAIIRTGVRLLLPKLVVIGDLADAWDAPSAELRPVVAFFRQHPKYLQGAASPADLVRKREERIKQLTEAAAAGEPVAELRTRVAGVDQRITATERMAQHQALRADFGQSLRRLTPATAVAAIGIVAFAWAANPPARTVTADLRNAKLTGAFLRDADLRNAKLDGADLTGADLTGAKLEGASLVRVIWARTTCPDGSSSEENGRTCAGHLNP
jgi:hypothetical protein